MKAMFCIEEPRILLDATGLISSPDCKAKIISPTNPNPITLEISEQNHTQYNAKDYLEYIADCIAKNILPCICVEQSCNGDRAYIVESDDPEYFTDVSYALVGDSLLIFLKQSE